MRFRRKQEAGEVPAVDRTPEPAPQIPEPGPEPPEPSYESPLSAQAAASSQGEHPEVMVGAAFVGGVALAQILKRFSR